MTLLDLTPRATVPERMTGLPVVIIGAGPVGLAAAAHLAERRIDFVVLEAGPRVATAMSDWGHIRLFSPWKHLVDPAALRLLGQTGWKLPSPDRAPLGRELVDDYLIPLSGLEAIGSRVIFNSEVLSVSREGMDRTRTRGRSAAPFAVRVRDAAGVVSEMTARAVVDASGTYGSPNPLGSNGLELLGLPSIADAVTGALPDVGGRDRAWFAGAHTTVVGAGHSAANTLLALVRVMEDEPGTTVSWLIRHERATRVSSSAEDELVDRARLGNRIDGAVASGRVRLVDRFEILRADRRPGGGVRLTGRREGELVTHDTDRVVNATGYRPNLDMLREVRLDMDDVVEAPRRLAPLIDPNLHSCGTVQPHGFRELSHPEPGFFIVGMKSYGRAPTFLLATGYEQVRSIAAWLAGDVRAASQVDLVLPATGVCSTDSGGGGNCC